jgi:uncharacterized flavoprotein (TIGR03862 family)
VKPASGPRITTTSATTIAIVGGGPAGLMAAETISQAGLAVDLYDAMPSVGRKFLMAGKSGLNLTHAEQREAFLDRYGMRRPQLEAAIDACDGQALRDWATGLGIDTFVGSSGRIFPTDMKAAPLLRAWLQRLRRQGVRFHVRHRWLGWADDGQLRFATPDGERHIEADATLLALGGGSWAKLGSDGAWLPWLQARGIAVAPLRPANCGFLVNWSEHFRARQAGSPVKAVIASHTGADGQTISRQGEFVISADGIEGSLIYAFSARLRDQIEAEGQALLHLDLAPGKTLARLTTDLARPRGRDSLANHLRRKAGIDGVKAALLRECLPPEALAQADAASLAAALKALPLQLCATRPLDEAISSAGGVCFDALDEHFMLRQLPGTFCAGEMLDWEAPTGGYLLTACFAIGRAAGQAMVNWLNK